MQPMKGKKHVEYKDTEKLLRGGRVRTTAFGAMLAIVKPEDTLESVLLRWADVRA